MTSCTSCGNVLSGKFCSQCGQAVTLARFDQHYIAHDIQHLLHLEKGFFHTVKELLLRPGRSIREYIGSNRSKLSKPIIFLFLASIIYALVEHYLRLEFSYIQFSESAGVDPAAKKSSVVAISNWVQAHYGYANIGIGLFTSCWLRLLFRKHSFNIFEITVLVFFVLAEALLLISAMALALSLAKFSIMYKVMGISFTVYMTWAIGQFFDSAKVLSYMKAFAAIVLGMVSFAAILVTSGLIHDAFF